LQVRGGEVSYAAFVFLTWEPPPFFVASFVNDQLTAQAFAIGVFYGPCAHSKAARKEGRPTMLAVG
jgi:hypothetical protein